MQLMTDSEVEDKVRQAAASISGNKVVVVIPDATRTAPVPTLFQLLCRHLSPRVDELIFLVALGTHPLMSDSELDQLVGMSAAERKRQFPNVGLLNHRWDLPETFTEVASLSPQETSELSEGRLSLRVPIRINRLLLEAEQVVIVGPVFPHEVAGFSGGHKYLFPGVGGADVINFTHWLGALMTSHATIGRTDTAVRQAIELAASRVPGERLALCLVTSKQGLHGLFWGEPKQAWRQATELSAQVHIHWCDRCYHRVLSIIPERYADVWTGAKGMYKVEPVLADGGEVVLLAPHITEFSYTHGQVLEQIGYHVRDYFVEQWERFKDYPWGVLAHSTHLRGDGSYENGVERPRVQVTLASGISAERCQALNLGYCDPNSILLSDWQDREDEGVLVVPNAGETLYRLRETS